jgi:cation diffusion facilitator CzcD-associated flavoprotein CzcO
MGSIAQEPSSNFDIIVIGAGISGINAGYRIQSELPNYKYTILEARGAIGGTWDLFRYPGIRSDSDLHTFGFPWRPWDEPKSIAHGTDIRNYIQKSAEVYGIDKKIRFHHRLISQNWSSDAQQWQLTVDANGEKTIFTTRFLIIASGYYDYHEPLKTHIPGIDNFQGQIIHPQFWPADLDYTGKKIVVIGSGATAITLVPNLTDKAEKVTMLQRSPTYVVALPAVDPLGDWMKRYLPNWIAFKLVRWKFLVLPYIFFRFCRAFPNVAKRALTRRAKEQLPANVPVDPNFSPSYNPWEQRLCVCPDGDFFKALKSGKADVVTDRIKTVTATGIETVKGIKIDADIIITATGLKMQLAGGSKISVDGKPLDVSEKYMWKGVMLQDLPNAAIVIGYTNASWTLGSDTTALHMTRLLKYMDKQGVLSATPRVKEGEKLKSQPLLNLNSTYIEKAKGLLPKAGNLGPWKPRANYLVDHWIASHGALTTDLDFRGVKSKV